MNDNDALHFKAIWDVAIPYGEFVESAQENRGLWEGVYRTTKIPEWALETACESAQGLRILAIVEDWCGDASNTVPVLAKLGDLAHCLEMRILERDQHPEMIDRYLTNGTRSIPIVIVLDEEFEELGHWGPRPAELQKWVIENKHAYSAEERYRRVRRWYATDMGESTLREVLRLIQ